MASSACRVCGRELFEKPLLRYVNMPKAAQHFPDASTLMNDAGVDLDVCQCATCGLVQLTGEPVAYYREVIRAAGVSKVVQEAKTRQFETFINKYSLQGKSILEIGCGRGEFLSLLQSMDIKPYGLEYATNAVQACVERGMNVSKGYPDPSLETLANGPYDAFLLLMFLEHMPDPNTTFRVIHNNLADGAVGIIEVPNFDMIVRKKLFSEIIGDHLLYFTEKTLRTTLEINGFDVVEVNEIRDEYVLSVVVKKRERLDISQFQGYQETIKEEVCEYLRQFPVKRVAVWGAGHQALAFIALTGIANYIRYVVDSALFKQGKYTPATHLPILAPEALRLDPVDAVIVMAASYSDEVVAILQNDFDRNLSVVILRDFGLEKV